MGVACVHAAGHSPPFIMRLNTGSVPVGYLVLSSETRRSARPERRVVRDPADVFKIPGISRAALGGVETIVLRADVGRLQSASRRTMVKRSWPATRSALGQSASRAHAVRAREHDGVTQDFGDIP